MLSASDDDLLGLPKAELHVHLDGSLRPATMLELARERGGRLPEREAEALARRMLVTGATRLEEYLEPFRITLSLLQDAPALERAAYELAEDHAAENVRYVEVRFCPALSTERGLAADEVLDAVLAGLARARRDHGIESRVIVCALRTLPPAASREMAELAVAYQDRGVCAFDLAGAEAGYPVHDHLEAFRLAEAAGLGITIHAGEGFGTPSIQEALELAHATRIGHGTRLGEDPELLERVRDAGIPLEVCLTSNVQTRVAPSYEEHPVRRYFDEGVRVCLCTDNRLMSGVTLTDEYRRARDALGFTGEELAQVARTAFACAFLPEEARRGLLEGFDAATERDVGTSPQV
ncbi:MAG TPA: adenosine deaminase [Longimicrobiales bacterium]|nr:adenosine deaminase [Longimicrobiales bacterium]